MELRNRKLENLFRCIYWQRQSGFTLIELIIAVAIIGLLAAITGPAYTRYRAKAAQSEAKIALSSIYSLEKSFYSEYSAYIPSLNALGYLPEGRQRHYKIGWGSGSTYPGTINSYTGTVSSPYFGGTNVFSNSNTVCDLNASFADSSIAGVNAGNDPQTFRPGATGLVQPGTVCDSWSINELKVLLNAEIGI